MKRLKISQIACDSNRSPDNWMKISISIIFQSFLNNPRNLFCFEDNPNVSTVKTGYFGVKGRLKGRILIFWDSP